MKKYERDPAKRLENQAAYAVERCQKKYAAAMRAGAVEIRKLRAMLAKHRSEVA